MSPPCAQRDSTTPSPSLDCTPAPPLAASPLAMHSSLTVYFQSTHTEVCTPSKPTPTRPPVARCAYLASQVEGVNCNARGRGVGELKRAGLAALCGGCGETHRSKRGGGGELSPRELGCCDRLDEQRAGRGKRAGIPSPSLMLLAPGYDALPRAATPTVYPHPSSRYPTNLRRHS